MKHVQQQHFQYSRQGIEWLKRFRKPFSVGLFLVRRKSQTVINSHRWIIFAILSSTKSQINNDSFEKQKKKNVTAVVFHFVAAVRENDIIKHKWK